MPFSPPFPPPPKKPTTCSRSSLGTLSTLLELRQLIYELAIDSTAPIRLHTNAALLSNSPRATPARRSRARGRFALLYVCKSVKKEVDWVLHHKLTLRLEINCTAGVHGIPPEENGHVVCGCEVPVVCTCDAVV